VPRAVHSGHQNPFPASAEKKKKKKRRGKVGRKAKRRGKEKRGSEETPVYSSFYIGDVEKKKGKKERGTYP